MAGLKMTVVELKEELKRRGLKRTGDKKTLSERLQMALRLEEERANDDDDDDAVMDNDANVDGERCYDEHAADTLGSHSDVTTNNDDANEVSSDSNGESCSSSDVNSEVEITRHRSSRRRRSHTPRVLPRAIFTFKDVEESLRTFSGDDEVNINKWLSEFEETSAVCGWTDEQNIVYAKRLLRGSAKLFVSFENCSKTWGKLREALRSEFAPKVNSRQVHKELLQRRKKPSESYHEYLYRMLEIASQAEVDIPSVLQYVVEGIPDDEVSKSILYGIKTVKEFREKLSSYEMMKQGSKQRPRDVQPKKFSHHSAQSNATTDHPQRCYNCGGKFHTSSNCPDLGKGKKCFNCQEFGHISAVCPKRSSVKPTCKAINEGVNHPKCIKEICIFGKPMSVFVDSGSDLTLMQATEYVRVGSPKMEQAGVKFTGVGTGVNSTLGKFRCEITVNEQKYLVTVHVIPDSFMNHPMMLGRDFLEQVHISLVGGHVTKIEKIINNEVTHSSQLLEICNVDAIEDSTEIEISHIPDVKDRENVLNLVHEYRPNKTRDTSVEMNIILTDDIPIYQRPRRLSQSELEEVEKQISTWLREGIIRPSSSEYASPVVLVKKKSGQTRMCIDFREINKKVIKDRYPLPLIEDQLDHLHNAKVFTTLDLRNGFFHVPIKKGCEKYTAFIVPTGHYEFLKVPFGLATSPAVFQRYICAVFKDLIADGTILVYMDDIVIPARDYRDGVEKLATVLKVASEAGLQINWKKCQLLRTKIEYLGHIVECGTIRPSEFKTAAVTRFPKPTNIQQVQRFLGLTGYFRKFIPGYATLAKPLSDLLRNGAEFQFGEEQEQAFDSLRNALTSDPVLRIYKPGAEIELHTDASKVGFGAMLMQRDSEKGTLHPIYYYSSKTSPAEEKYTSYELEVLAIIKALRKFRVYLLGTKFKIVTDCRAFQMTLNKKDLCVRVARWVLLLEEFDYVVEHRSGSAMRHVDALSRAPLPQALLVEECDVGILARIKKAQNDDPDLKKYLENPQSAKVAGFACRHGLLYKEVGDELFLVIPKLMQLDIIKTAHGQGHFSVQKTESIVRRDYWFNKMREKIEKVIQNCVPCILAERKHGKKEGFLHPIDKGDLPLDTYHVDHLGPLPSTKKAYQHILVVVDAFSKFTWLYPTRSTTAEEVIARLKKQAATFGNPRRIVSDRGSAFTSNLFEEYCRDENIANIRISTGVPRANGQVERMNRILIPLLSKLASPHPQEWHRYTDLAQQLMNATPTRSTGYSPLEVMVGKRMRLKCDPELKDFIEQEVLTAFQEERDEIRRNAKASIEKIQQENRRSFNKKRKKATEYKVGDLVAIRRKRSEPGLKFCSKFLGPYKITKILRNDRYVVEKVGEHEGPRGLTTPVDDIKRWTSSSDPPDWPDSEEEASGTDA